MRLKGIPIENLVSRSFSWYQWLCILQNYSLLSFAATSVALERVEAYRIRLSFMDPSDGPVSAYKSAQQELNEAEVDYNYCLYFPSNKAFQSPPLSTARKSTPKNENERREFRLCLWSMVEQCMKEGTLQDLKDGRIPVGSPERLAQPFPAQVEQIEGQGNLQISTATNPKQVQVLGQFALQ